MKGKHMLSNRAMEEAQELKFSFIVPVYNRPGEIRELLQSMKSLTGDASFEVVIVEDGSHLDAAGVIEDFSQELEIAYYKKENTGPGHSRNYGMQRARGNYFIILDSDCLLPKDYLMQVKRALRHNFTHCYGGPDAAHPSFTNLQKAIDFVMTSFWTTGGIRGNKRHIGRFQPRSFNMGISKEVFQKTQGFGRIHPGEDPDLTFRIWKLGYETRLLPKAFVYHKRRVDWNKFAKQVFKFGLVRPILTKWHPETAKFTYWFPTFFSLAALGALGISFLGILWALGLLGSYVLLVFLSAWMVTGKGTVAFLVIPALFIQFFGYGWGFLKSTMLIRLLRKPPRTTFPDLFYGPTKSGE